MDNVNPSAADTPFAPPLLQMRGITKTFFGVPVLEDVDLDALVGEVHAVVGENGAGKSTLMKILAGAHQPDAGSMLIDGEEVRFGHPREAQEQGVSIIYQEFTLLPERTVAQNIFLGREPTRGPFVDARAMEDATAMLLTELGAEQGISPAPWCAISPWHSSRPSRSPRRSPSRRASWSWTSRPPPSLRMRSMPSSRGCVSCKAAGWPCC